MKKLLSSKLAIIIFGFLFLQYSCNEKEVPAEDPNKTSGYYLQFKANGVQKRYSNEHMAVDFNIHDNHLKHSAVVIGSIDALVAKDQLLLTIWGEPNGYISGNSYSFENPLHYTTDMGIETSIPEMLITYIDEDGETFITINAPWMNMVGNDPDEGDVLFESIDNKEVKGTFKGKLRNSESAKTVMITEGEFFLPVYPH